MLWLCFIYCRNVCLVKLVILVQVDIFVWYHELWVDKNSLIGQFWLHLFFILLSKKE